MNFQTKLRIDITESDHSRGNKNAPTTLVEYGDYECSYCGEANVVMNQIQEEMGNELHYVFRNFPLTNLHPHASFAARAAEAAGIQGQFWQMHDLLFENQSSLDIKSILQFAIRLNLNINRFRIDFRGNQIMDKIKRDLQGGALSGVNGTPCFFVNGYRYEDDWSYPTLRARLLEMQQGLAA